uniref:Retrovirus-related Pol polyprotein from transposon TNT 1-94 n=1 Tax=Cajanus cajan TaxID=3821 RepID=A0A151U487_CAJCA|nr:Retrovirus-related Pol polyprotein from transposon TNT 1-94 [Cajanus cajan]
MQIVGDHTRYTWIYLMQTKNETRTHITNFITLVENQFIYAPTTTHSQAIFCILCYLKQAPGSGIFLSANSTPQLKAFIDSDWDGCPGTRRSITGFSIYLGDSLISWRSKKQLIVSRSSLETEYRALTSTTCEIQWLTYLLEDLCIQFTRPAILYCDNQSAIQIATNQFFHERTKHIEIDFHIVREKVNSSLLKLLPVTSSLQLADIFTKALSPTLFQSLRSKLGMMNIHSQLEGVLMIICYMYYNLFRYYVICSFLSLFISIFQFRFQLVYKSYFSQ